MISELKKINEIDYYNKYRILNNGFNEYSFYKLLLKKEEITKNLHNFNYMIDNKDKLTNEQFLKVYNYFYRVDTKSIILAIANSLFKEARVTNLKTNRVKLMDNQGEYYLLKYQVIKDKDTNLDKDKVYTLKEIQDLINKGVIFLTGNKTPYQMISPKDIKKYSQESHMSSDKTSELAIELIKKELTKEKLIEDYNKSILGYSKTLNGINQALSEYKKAIISKGIVISSMPEVKKYKFPLKRNK